MPLGWAAHGAIKRFADVLLSRGGPVTVYSATPTTSPLLALARRVWTSRTNRGSLWRLAGFAAAGASGILVNQFVLWVVTETFGPKYVIAPTIATAASTTWNFCLIERLVFRASSTGRLGRFLRFSFVNVSWLVPRVPLYFLLTVNAGWHYQVSNLFLLLAFTIPRFILSDRWIWAGAGSRGGMQEKPSVAARRYLYDIHGIIRVSSQARLPELEVFQVPLLSEAADLDVVVGWRGFGGLRRRSYVEATEKSVSYIEQLGPAGFAMQVQLGTPTRVRVSPLVRMSPHVLYTNVVEPLLRWKFVERGYALAHAACLELNGAGLLLTARTDTGKTTTCLRSIHFDGARFLSDDMTILTPEGTALAYPKPLTISAHTFQAVKAAPLPLWRKAWLQVQGRLHSRSGRQVALRLAERNLPVATFNAVVQFLIPPPKFHVGRLVPKAELLKSVTPTHLVLIERDEARLEDLGLDEACEVLMENTEDAYGFPPYPFLASALSAGKAAAEASAHRSMLQGVRRLRLRTPDREWYLQLPDIASNKEFPDPPTKSDRSVAAAASSLRAPGGDDAA